VRFLLVFLVVLVLAWRWRTWRASEQQRRASDTPPKTTDMVRCAQCGMHVPAHEAVVGLKGQYCSTAHRLSMEP
jgi:uncharacterized protein